MTRYPGRGWADLERAIRTKTAEGIGAVWGPFSLFEYFRDRRRWNRFLREHKVRLHDM